MITNAEVRRRLPVGTEYIGELLGPGVKPEMKAPMRRKIVKISPSDMGSELLEGPSQGKTIFLGSWKEVKAREENDSIILSNAGLDILKITVTP